MSAQPSLAGPSGPTGPTGPSGLTGRPEGETPGRPEAETPGRPEAEAPGPQAAIVVDHVSRWYGNVVAVNDISFAVQPGVTGLLGPNGAGKTTLLHMTAGLLAPSAGSVRIEGVTVWRDPSIYRRVGLVPERESAWSFVTGREMVLANAVLHGLREPERVAAKAIDRVDLGAAADRRVGTYSKGMRQRIKMASALVHDPPVLILDEPFNGMDPRQRLQMFELLRTMADEGRTILLSSHILEEVERVAESVLVIYAGRLAAAGDFRSLRQLMTDRPHVFSIRSSGDRQLGAALLAEPSVFGVELDDSRMLVRTSDYGAFTRRLPRLAREAGISILELAPTDDSLESVFAYLVGR